MDKASNQNTDRDALNSICGLMMEVNYHEKVDESIIAELDNDPAFAVQLLDLKKVRTKYRAKSFKVKLLSIVDEFQKLKEMGSEKLSNLLTPEERLETAPLFRKFEELTSHDQEQILEDQELLKFIEIMKDKLDSDE